jgi:hypothetical protein
MIFTNDYFCVVFDCFSGVISWNLGVVAGSRVVLRASVLCNTLVPWWCNT